MGHIHSEYTDRYPLQTELMYAVDADANASYWISTQQELDPWLVNYFPAASKKDFDEFYPGRGNIFWRSDAPMQEIPKGKVEVLTDSTANQKRTLTLRVTPDSTTRGFRIYFANNVTPLAINDRTMEPTPTGEVRFIQFFASTPGGTTIEFEMAPDEPADIWVIEQRPGLPGALLNVPLPPNFIHRPDYLSNSSQVKYRLKI